jgi:hypothetical protein
VAFVLNPNIGVGELDVASHHGERSVSEELLEGEDIPAAEEEPFRAGVPEGMRGGSDAANLGSSRVGAHLGSQSLAGQTPSGPRDEQRVGGLMV